MRTMRVAMVLAAVITSAITAPLAAQGQGGAERQGGMRGDPVAMQARQNEMLFEGITLSAEQKMKVDSIQTAARTAQQASMQGGGMRDPETRERMRTQRQATMTAIRTVLTAEQQTVFDRNLGNMPGMQAGSRPDAGQRPPR